MNDERAEELALPPAVGQGPEGSARWRIEPHSCRIRLLLSCTSRRAELAAVHPDTTPCAEALRSVRHCLRASWMTCLMCMVQPAHMEEVRRDPPASCSMFAHDIAALAAPPAGGQWALASCALGRACARHVPRAPCPSLRDAVASIASQAHEERRWTRARGRRTCPKLDLPAVAGSLLMGVMN